MRKIVLNLAISLDGYIEGANGEYDWCIMDDDMGFDTFFNRFDAAFYGRKSYQLFGNQNPETFSNDAEREAYQQMQNIKKYVFSDTLKEVGQGDELINSQNFLETVQQLKTQAGKDIWLFGGSSLVTAFVNNNLVDEYQLGLHPIVLGAGKPLFIDIQKRVHLKLVNTKPTKSGVVMLTYVPNRD
jgi:dihydrofolate reductase